MAIICLSGWKQSGKDTLANYLIEKHNAVRAALADPLKDMVSKEFNIDRLSLDDPKRKELPLLNLPVDPKDEFSKMLAEFMIKEFRSKKGDQPESYLYHEGKFFGVFSGDSVCKGAGLVYHTPRSLAILKGSTNRFVRSDYWTDKAFGDIENKLLSNKLIVVSDLRYKTEIIQFSERFGNKVVFVRINRFKESPSQDPSERDLDNAEFDYYIDNTTTLENAYNQIEEILARLIS